MFSKEERTVSAISSVLLLRTLRLICVVHVRELTSHPLKTVYLWLYCRFAGDDPAEVDCYIVVRRGGWLLHHCWIVEVDYQMKLEYSNEYQSGIGLRVEETEIDCFIALFVLYMSENLPHTHRWLWNQCICDCIVDLRATIPRRLRRMHHNCFPNYEAEPSIGTLTFYSHHYEYKI